MKTHFLLLPILLLFLSCEVQGDLTRDGIQKMIDAPNSVLKYEGKLVPTDRIKVTGAVKIYLEKNHYQLELDEFSISEGPDLKVYLSKSNTPNDFVNLGNLTSETVYTIPQNVDVSVYSYVLIHCQQYNHLFAIAELTKK